MIAPTRQPFPWTSEAKHRLVGASYALVGVLLRPIFRRPIRIEDLSDARILILKPCCLGDVVFSTALLRELRRNLPRAHLAYAVGSHSRAALQGAPIDEIVDTGPVGSGPYRLLDLLALIRRLRAGHYDACFVLERSAILALVPLLAGIPRRIGIDSFGRGFSLGVGVSPRPIRAEAELYLDLLRAIGGTIHSRELDYHSSAAAEARVERLLADSGIQGRYVVLHVAGGVNPGLALTRKRWPPESFVALAKRIVAAGADIVLVGADEDRAVAETIRRGFPSPPGTLWMPPARARGEGDDPDGTLLGSRARSIDQVPFEHDLSLESPSPRARGGGIQRVLGGEGRLHDLTGQLTLDELAALARRASVYVGIDSGPSHLAEAAGANVVMLFGPTDPLLYGPRADRAVAITSGLWCSPCFEDGRVAPCVNVRCMPAITVERVWREVARFMERETPIDVITGVGP